MGILRTREEYLPVTCAILKPEDREAFFSAIKKQENGRPEHIARACETTVEIVNDWISGKSNVPYHSLQTLAHQYQITMPAVGELRRECLAVSQAPARRENPQAPPPPGRTRESRPPRARKEPRERPAKRARAERKPRREAPAKEAKRPRRQEGAQPKRRERPKAQRAPQPPKGPRVPQPSELLAYWVGMTLMTGRREGADLIMAADRRIGQNFAGSWAALTRDLFGVKPSLQMLDGGKVQEARLQVAGFEEFLDRLDLKENKAFNEAGVPRWAWSNPAWKMGCLKGIVDARAHFQRAPAIVVEGVPERLATAILKMLASLKLEAVVNPGKAIEIRGAAAVDHYFENIGTGNMKLRDQYRAFKSPSGGRPQGESEPAGEPEAEPVESEDAPAELPVDEAGEKDSGLAPADEVEAAGAEAESADERRPDEPEAPPEQRAAEAQPERRMTEEERLDAEAARKANASGQPSRFAPPPPQPKQDRPPRRHRTLFRGRPKR